MIGPDRFDQKRMAKLMFVNLSARLIEFFQPIIVKFRMWVAIIWIESQSEHVFGSYVATL